MLSTAPGSCMCAVLQAQKSFTMDWAPRFIASLRKKRSRVCVPPLYSWHVISRFLRLSAWHLSERFPSHDVSCHHSQCAENLFVFLTVTVCLRFVKKSLRLLRNISETSKKFSILTKRYVLLRQFHCFTENIQFLTKRYEKIRKVTETYWHLLRDTKRFTESYKLSICLYGLLGCRLRISSVFWYSTMCHYIYASIF